MLYLPSTRRGGAIVVNKGYVEPHSKMKKGCGKCVDKDEDVSRTVGSGIVKPVEVMKSTGIKEIPKLDGLRNTLSQISIGGKRKKIRL